MFVGVTGLTFVSLSKAAGCKFALGLADEKGEFIGVAVCGRPVKIIM